MSPYNEWTPIGDKDNKFSGTIIGNNHYIMNIDLELESPEDPEEMVETLSLFGMVENAEFHNINFKNINMKSPKDVTLLASYMDGNSKITNSKIEPTVNLETTDNGYIGGFAVIVNGNPTLHNNFAEFEVKNANTAGMFIAMVLGNTETLNLAHSTAKSKVENNQTYGGFVGTAVPKNINLYNSIASATGTSKDFGGFIGNTPSNENVIAKDLIATDINIDSTGYVGTIIGMSQSDNLTIENVAGENIEITGGTTGGLVGMANTNLIIDNVDLLGNLNGSSNTGGIIGANYNGENTRISNINFQGNITSNQIAGGIGGIINTNIELEKINVIGDINGDDITGGIIGGNYDGDLTTMSNIIYQGNVTSNNSSAGGIGGQINCNNNLDDITVIGEITGEDVGGVIASNYEGNFIQISNVIQEVKLQATRYAGGVIGATNVDAIINNVNLKGSIELTSDSDIGSIGGLVGTSGGIKAADIQINSNIIGGSYTGGIAGESYKNLELLNISVIGDIIGSDYSYGKAGGISGHNGTSTIITVENINITGDVYGKSGAGGLFGEYYKPLMAEHIRFKGNITSDKEYGGSGGIAGYSSHYEGKDLINNAEILGDIDSYSYSGGFYGQLYASVTITNSKFEGNVFSIEENGIAGGIIGFTSGYSHNISEVDVIGNITAHSKAGGIFGEAHVNSDLISNIFDITYNGYIKAIGENEYAGYAGGVAGFISNPFYTNNITIESNIDGYTYAGGIFGFADSPINTENITFIGTTTSLNGITSDTIAGKGKHWEE